jgi:hypothetical protein
MNYLPIIKAGVSRFSVVIAADMSDNPVNLSELAFRVVRGMSEGR